MCGDIRPSKFLLPDKTDTAYIFSFSIASTILSGNGPEFPMHVVHP